MSNKKKSFSGRLDVIANAISYTHLLHRHIDKEEGVVYKYAQNKFSSATMEILEHECERFEQDAEDSNIQKKYLDMISAFEAKV